MDSGGADTRPFWAFLSFRFEEHHALAAATANRMHEYSMLAANLNDGRADPSSALARSLRKLDGCDAVVTFVGETRGPVDDTGRTFVEHELARAIDQLKPVYAYVADGVDERSPTWPLVTMLKESYPVVYGKLSRDDNDSAWRVVADVLAQPLGSGEPMVPGPLINGPGITDEADRLGFADRLVEQSRSNSPVKADLLQRQTWAFDAITERRSAGAVEHLRQAIKIRSDDWLSNYALVWVAVNTGSHGLLAEGIDAGRVAVETAEYWRSGEEDTPGGMSVRRVDASRLLLARLLAVRGNYEDADMLVDAVLDRSPTSVAALSERFRIAARRHDLPTLLAAAELLRRHHLERLDLLVRSSELTPPFRGEVERAIVERMMPGPSGPVDATEGMYARRLAELRNDLESVLERGRDVIIALDGELQSTGRRLWPTRPSPSYALFEDVVERRNTLADRVTDLRSRLEMAEADVPEATDSAERVRALAETRDDLRLRATAIPPRISDASDTVDQADGRLDAAELNRGDTTGWDLLIAAAPFAATATSVALIVSAWETVVGGWPSRWLTTLIALAVVGLGAISLRERWWESWTWGVRRARRWLRWRRKRSALRRAESRLRALQREQEAIDAELRDVEQKLSETRSEQDAARRARSRVESLDQELKEESSMHVAVVRLYEELIGDDVAVDGARVRARIRELNDHKDRFAGWAEVLLRGRHDAFWKRRVGELTTVSIDLTESRLVKGGLPQDGSEERLVRLIEESPDASWLVSDLAAFAISDDEVERFIRLEEFILGDYGRPAVREPVDAMSDWPSQEGPGAD